MEKRTRFAACDPCRRLKLACDHRKPQCSRCVRSGRLDECTYRERPFKRRHCGRVDPIHVSPPAPVDLHAAGQELIEHRYPNSGHLGQSSSASIFGRLPPNNDSPGTRSHRSTTLTGSMRLSNRLLEQQTQVLEEILNTIDAEALDHLTRFWLAKKICLGLSSIFVEASLRALQHLLKHTLFDTSDLETISQKLTDNSTRALGLSSTSTAENLAHEIGATQVRWESIALALTLAGRATTDVPFFPPLYTSRIELNIFQRTLANLSDSCLEIVVSLDSMNEFLLICQFESFVFHSILDGDQSYSVWRRLGDLTSSLLFLGLNEEIVDDVETPLFFTELRRSIFAQIYADDKNVAVFLGRPPRLNRTFCTFQLPGTNRNELLISNKSQRPMVAIDHVFFDLNDQVSYVTGLRWTACCASLKEEILEILQDHNAQSEGVVQRLNAIYSRAESLWHSLPDHLRLKSNICTSVDTSPLERDFLLNIRLTYLQILFLTKIRVVTSDGVGLDSEGSELLQISHEMLSLVVKAIVLRDQLVDSGTSLLWKVVHYGLPAAGAICFFVLDPSFTRLNAQKISVATLMQNLGVFASEIQIGGVLQAGAPNFSLLQRAASTIQSVFQAVFSPNGLLIGTQRTSHGVQPLSEWETQPYRESDTFDLSAYADLWGFEYDFWQDLGAHPSLLPSTV